MEFTKTTLGEISLGKGQYGIGASAVDYADNLYTYLRITDINDDGTLNMTDLKSVNDEKAGQYVLQPNDIVFARTGNSTGRNYFYDGSDGTFVYAGFLIKFSIDPEKVNPKFIKYYCLSDKYKDWVQGHSTGSTRGNINAQTYANMEITLPPREQQDRLVSILEDLENKRKTNNVINRNLSEQANLYYEEWKQSVIGKKIELSAVIDVRDGTHASPKAQEKGFPLVTSKHLLEYDVDLISPNKISQKDYDKVNERSKVDYHDVLMSMIGTVGLVSFVSRKKVNFAIKNVALFKTSQKQEFAYYLLMYLKSSETQKYIKACLAGSTQQYISLAELRKMPILVPNVDELVKFNAVAEPIIDLICANVKENQRLVQIRDILLPKLMSGELDVSKLDI